MEENIFYEEDKIKNFKEDENITPITNELDKSNDNNNKPDELVSSLPSWDLIPPYEEIRRVVK